MLIDTHTHTNFDAFKDDYKEVIDRALGENIRLINVGSDLATSKRAVEIANEYKEGVYAAVGLHPTVLEENFDEQEFLKLAQNEKVVAIGETGLDYFRNQASEKLKNQLIEVGLQSVGFKEEQKKLFIKHIELSKKVGKPLIIHCRDAHDDLLKILEPRTYNLEPTSGVMHFFTGTVEQARKYIDLGFYISFSGVITFAKTRSGNSLSSRNAAVASETRSDDEDVVAELHQGEATQSQPQMQCCSRIRNFQTESKYDIIVKELPLDKILIETDAPYVSPAPMRGKRNEPSYVKYVAQKIAELKGITVEEVARQTTENAKRLFGI